MRRPDLFIVVFFAIVNLSAFAQNQNPHFKMVGQDPKFITIDESFSETKEIKPFGNNINKIYGLAASAEINLHSPDSKVEIVFVDDKFNEYLVAEAFSDFQGESTFQLEEVCEETCVLDGAQVYSIIINVKDADVILNKLHYVTRSELAGNVNEIRKQIKKDQNADKISQINKNLKSRGQNWVAGLTGVSELSYSEKKQLFGQSTFPPGFEFYAGGVISTSNETTALKSAATSSPYIDEWDWRDRHGKNWITSIKNQSTCGSCWAFATTGATEALVNVYYNQQLNLDLSEQDILSCSGAGDCDGGSPYSALNYIKNTGIVDEATFPYSATDQPCSNKGENPSETIKISGKIDFGFDVAYDEDILKSLIIKYGPLSGGVGNWYHAMPLVGYKVVKEGDIFYCRDINLTYTWKTINAGDPLIGKTVWIFKNSWGKYYGDNGYVYVETPITNINWTHALQTPVTSLVNNYDVKCTDTDGDGYFWWGLGPKPANCPPCPDLADGDDSDPTLGPLDQYGYCMPIGLVASPVANFTASPTTLNEGGSVSFTDVSTNTPTTWEWAFEGGIPETSTEKNPTVRFDNPGQYNVSLKVSNTSGSNTKSVDSFITVNRILTPPLAGFTADQTTIKTGNAVQYTDLSTNTPTSWNWTFEGGTPASSSAQNPKVTYNTAGIFNVSLTAANADGSNVKTLNNYITVTVPTPPIANFTANTTSITAASNVTFTDLSQNNPTSWFWEFEGGSPSTATDQNPTITYNIPGTYDVTLTATNADGSNSNTYIGYIEVNEQQVVVANPPVAEFSASSTSIETGQYVAFTDNSTNSPTAWAWSFAGGYPSTSNEQNPEVLYNASGKFSVSVTVTNADGSATKTLTEYIYVSDPIPAPVADFISDKTKINEGDVVTFADKSQNNPASWKWVFDGGNPSSSTEKNPKVTYSSANSYKVSLTVTNAAGYDVKTIENYILVEKFEPEYCTPTANASAEWISKVVINGDSNTSGKEGYADFTATKAFNLEAGTTNSIQLVPDFSGRGSFEYWVVWIDYNSDFEFTDDEIVFSPSKSKSSVTGSFLISANTELTTRMRIAMGTSAPTSCTNSLSGEVEDYTVIISQPVPQPPVADFAANVYSINVGESIQFADLSTNDPGTWQWSFPGSMEGSSTAQNPVITYNTTGTYDVTLTVSKDGFTPSTVTKTALITVNELNNNTIITTYCEPVDINSAVNYISGVTIGSVFSNNTGAESYSLWNETINLVAGKSYNVDLYPSEIKSRNFWRIWFDFNKDGDFEDADETLLTANNTKGTVVSSISIPSYASGTIRMRISMKTGNTPASCDDGFEGEVEDYEVSFGVQNNGVQMASSIASTIDVEQEFSISVYPNPTIGIVRLNLSEIGVNDKYSVFSSIGAKILENRIDQSTSEIDLSNHPSGMYILVVSSSDHHFTQKIIKK